MKKILLTSCLCVFAAPVVFAQGNTITVIHEDGSKDVMDLDDLPSASRSAPPPELTRKPAPTLGDVIEKTVEPVPEAVVASEIVVEPPPAEKPKEAPKKPVKTASKPAPKPAPRAEIADADWPPIPPRKPYVSAAIAPKAAAATRGYITPQEATHIALNVAPPARDFAVQARGANFAVVFKTGEGDFEVLVDSNSGDVLSKGYVETAVSAPRPGHLPLR